MFFCDLYYLLYTSSIFLKCSNYSYLNQPNLFFSFSLLINLSSTHQSNAHAHNSVGNIGLSASSESIYQTKYTRSRGNSTRHHPHRISSRRNKENGSSSGLLRNGKSSNNVKKQKSPNENLSKSHGSDNNGSNNTLKVNHNHPVDDTELIQSSNNKSRIVSFGDTPIIVKVSSKTNVLHIPFAEQPDHTF